VGNSRGARKLARTPHINKKKKNRFLHSKEIYYELQRSTGLRARYNYSITSICIDGKTKDLNTSILVEKIGTQPP
jgi:hypothetical protein